jgi:hypothetical protein
VSQTYIAYLQQLTTTMRVLPLAISAVLALSKGISGHAAFSFSSPRTTAKRTFGASNQNQKNTLRQRTIWRNSPTSVEPVETEAVVFPEKNKQEFVNDGPLAWMNRYLDMFGIREGKAVAYGAPVDVDESKRPTPEVAQQLRQDAAKLFQNIGMDERERRATAGNIFAAVTVVYAIWASLLADQGNFEGHVLRFMSVIPLFFTVGYKLSAETGL